MPVIEPPTLTTGTGLGTPFRKAGAPGITDFLANAVNGSLLIDTTNGQLYQATANTGTAVTWVKVGTES